MEGKKSLMVAETIRLDSPLTDAGIEHARAMGAIRRRAISDPQAVLIEASPLGRARQTAAILADVMGLDLHAVVERAVAEELRS